MGIVVVTSSSHTHTYLNSSHRFRREIDRWRCSVFRCHDVNIRKIAVNGVISTMAAIVAIFKMAVFVKSAGGARLGRLSESGWNNISSSLLSAAPQAATGLITSSVVHSLASSPVDILRATWRHFRTEFLILPKIGFQIDVAVFEVPYSKITASYTSTFL